MANIFYFYVGKILPRMRKDLGNRRSIRTTMYLAQAQNGRFNVIKELGAIDPKERMVAAH